MLSMLREPTALSGQGEGGKGRVLPSNVRVSAHCNGSMVMWILAFLAIALLFPPWSVIGAGIWSSFWTKTGNLGGDLGSR